MQRPRILLILPLLSCALPLPAEWHGNSSLIHALLLAVSTGTVLLHVLLNKAGMQGIMESVRLYPTVGIVLILLSQAMKVEGFSVFKLQSLIFTFTLFDNPAGLACFACCLLAIENGNKAEGKWRQWWHWTVMVMLMLIVLFTHSRTGMLAVLLIAAIRLWQYKRLRWGIGLAAVLCLVGLLQVKQDSTSGRRFILQNTWQMICERPLTGWGWHGFDKHYMQFQAEYFKQHPEDTANAWLADDVRHPMNEFLLWWVRFGIAGPVALGGLLLWPAGVKGKAYRVERKDEGSIDGMPIYTLLSLISTLLMFACLSYPLHYAFTWLFIGLAWYKIIDERLKMKDVVTLKSRHISNLLSLIPYLLIAIGLTTLFLSARLMQAEEAAGRRAHHRALRIYRQLELPYRWSPHYLYSYAHELYVTGQFDKALVYADRCEDYWSRYDLTLLKGDIHRQLQQYDEAEMAYHTASLMCPNRFAPLEGLLTVYQETGETTAANQTARQILSKKVKVGSEAIKEIRDMAKQCISRYNNP